MLTRASRALKNESETAAGWPCQALPDGILLDNPQSRRARRVFGLEPRSRRARAVAQILSLRDDSLQLQLARVLENVGLQGSMNPAGSPASLRGISLTPHSLKAELKLAPHPVHCCSAGCERQSCVEHWRRVPG